MRLFVACEKGFKHLSGDTAAKTRLKYCYKPKKFYLGYVTFVTICRDLSHPVMNEQIINNITGEKIQF